jgi:hypothetical protein
MGLGSQRFCLRFSEGPHWGPAVAAAAAPMPGNLTLCGAVSLLPTSLSAVPTCRVRDASGWLPGETMGVGGLEIDSTSGTSGVGFSIHLPSFVVAAPQGWGNPGCWDAPSQGCLAAMLPEEA